jgi:hypothetical protein
VRGFAGGITSGVTRYLCQRLPRADPERQEQNGAARSAVLEQLLTRELCHLGLLAAAARALHLEAGAA